MVKRKAGRPSKTRKRAPKKPARPPLVRKIIGFGILLAAVFLAGVFTHYLLVHTETAPGRKPAAGAYRIPAFEIFPKEDEPPQKPTPPEPPKLPRVAIIIDDLGYDRQIADRFFSLNEPLTLSILPHSPFQKRILKKAQRQGIETMLHLPMEPMEYPHVHPGPGALLTTMTPDALIVQLEKNLDALPTIRGVNNHMGSKMTTLSTQMYQIFSILKRRNLYFVDSRTTAESLSRPSARLLHVPFAQRDIFLDHEPDVEFIRKQLRKLVQMAVRHGEAIGIAHPHEITYEILKETLPKLKNQVELVPASAVVHIVG